MFFQKAVPVFPKGRENEMNAHVGFAAYLPQDAGAVLYAAGVSTYTVFLNGRFIHYGPARACAGKYRVEEIPLGAFLTEERNVLTIRLTAYNCNTYHYCMAPGFLQAEVRGSGGEVLAFTAEQGGMECYRMEEQLQRVPRYSFQRGFAEVVRLNETLASFALDPAHSGHKKEKLARQPEKTLLPRELALPAFARESAEKLIARGTVRQGPEDRSYRRREHRPTEKFFCYPMEECECISMDEYLSMERSDPTAGEEKGPWLIPADAYAILSFGREKTGLLSLRVTAEKDCEVFLAFDELLPDGRINAIRNGTCNLVKYTLAAGTYELTTAEPYSLAFLEVSVRGGDVLLSTVEIIRVGFPEIAKKLRSDDPAEQKIFDAAVQTFRQNTFDAYMDCPSRERAGWLCDSFFTSRVEYALTGRSDMERVFLGNFLDAESFPHLPEGMLPMCYPADHTDGNFIPNWAMWYVLELREYFSRSGDRALVDRAKPRVLGLVRYFDDFLNADGLLEKLQAWVFVEWSRANHLVQDVNFPTNALYAAMLDAITELYGLSEYAERADRIRRYIRSHARVEKFYCDNALRENGTLRLSGECTEVCQYYMFYFGVASPESDPELWRILRDEFGPDRQKNGLYPEIYPANAFIGNYLRLDYLARRGLMDQVLREMRGYFLYMSETTGTLWEHVSPEASCNHGFASHAAVWLLQARGER